MEKIIMNERMMKEWIRGRDDEENDAVTNLINWGVLNVTGMNHTVMNCRSLKDLNISIDEPVTNLINWGVLNVTDMGHIVMNCRSLKDLNISIDESAMNEQKIDSPTEELTEKSKDNEISHELAEIDVKPYGQ